MIDFDRNLGYIYDNWLSGGGINRMQYELCGQGTIDIGQAKCSGVYRIVRLDLRSWTTIFQEKT